MSVKHPWALALLAALLPGPGLLAATNSQQQVEVRTAKPAPAFMLPDLQDRPVRLADFNHKALIIFFWASWDQPCQRQLPSLIELQQQFGPLAFQVLGISLDRDSSAQLQKFAAEHNLNFPILRFDLKVIEDFGGLTAIPTLFVIDSNHNIIQTYIGVVEKSVLEDDLRLILKK